MWVLIFLRHTLEENFKLKRGLDAVDKSNEYNTKAFIMEAYWDNKITAQDTAMLLERLARP